MKYVYLGGNRGCSDDDDDRDCNQGNACVSRAGLVAIVSFEIVRSETSLILLSWHYHHCHFHYDP